MVNVPCSMGRAELATRYFPYIQPQSAWLKLKTLLLEDPALTPLAKLKRRTFLPAEVNIIYQHLGQPWAALFSAFSLLRVSRHETRIFIIPNCNFPNGKSPANLDLSPETNFNLQNVNHFSVCGFSFKSFKSIFQIIKNSHIYIINIIIL